MNFHPTQASAAKWAPDRSGLPARGRTSTVVRRHRGRGAELCARKNGGHCV